MIKKCKECGQDFEAKTSRKIYCGPKCKGLYLNRIECNKLEESGEENIDYIKCKWCGLAVTRVYGGHIKRYHPDKTSVDYRTEFPDALVATPSDTNKTHKNAGQHMKQDKYRKLASEAITGDKNPMSKKNASEQKRKETSPFSIEFYRKRFPGKTDDEYKEMVSEKVGGFLKDRLTWNQTEYWLAEGFTKDEAKEKISELQNRGLEYLKNKYGEDEGLERWKNRQEKWLKNYKKTNFSKVSQTLFKSLHEHLHKEYKEIYFAVLDKDKNIDESGKNYEYRLKLDNKVILPDFFIKDLNKIIEFDGVYWHRNTPENSKREDERDRSILNSGYNVFHVSEKDYRDDPKKVIKECLEFIRN